MARGPLVFLFYFATKTYVVGIQLLSEELLMSTCNKCFLGEIRKISILFDEKEGRS